MGALLTTELSRLPYVAVKLHSVTGRISARPARWKASPQ
jgi:hypothetical protein